ncbi:unnamed protein product [Didymodactylos carnosus]|uniref:Uncharacterized protein n=1 Tax=Didymodactylos carnosus TaxID=1234261 RepID=A0A814F5L6_9BILA|nr:unnamed protein product [Didymodactylos carnosus]CAF3751315.1 unnamed protein product [Didymodactylos carnosus]
MLDEYGQRSPQFPSKNVHPISQTLFNRVVNTTERQQQTPSFIVILTIAMAALITVTSTCVVIFLLCIRLQCYRKFRSRRRDNSWSANVVKTSINNQNSLSSVLPNYGCVTPSNSRYPSLPMTTDSNLSLPNNDEIKTFDTYIQQHTPSIRTNDVYEEITSGTDQSHPCCTCTLTWKRHCLKPIATTNLHHPGVHLYYACEPQPSAIVCQTCLLESAVVCRTKTLQQQQKLQPECLCTCNQETLKNNFFIPIRSTS